MEQPIDFQCMNEGTIIMLYPLSEDAQAWVGEHLPPDAPRLGSGAAIEHRYFDPIATGILGDGLTLQDKISGRMATTGR